MLVEPLISSRSDQGIDKIEFGNTTVVRQIRKSIEDLHESYTISKAYLKSGIISAVLNKDNTLIYAITKSCTLIVFNPLTKEIEKTLNLSNNLPTCITVSTEQNLITIGTNHGKIIGVDFTSFTIKFIHNYRDDPIKSIAITAESLYIINASNEMVSLAKNDGKAGSTKIPDREFILQRKDGTFFSGGLEDIRLQTSFFYATKIYEARDKVLAIFHTHKYVLASLENNICEIIEIETGKILDDIYVLDTATYITMTTDEKILIVGDNLGKVTFYDLEYPDIHIEFQMSSRPITFLYIMQETRQLFAFSGEIRVSIVNIPNFDKVRSTKAFTNFLMFVGNDKIAYKERETIYFLDLRTNQPKPVFKMRGLSPVFCFIKPYHLVSTAGQSLIFLNVQNSKLTQFKHSKVLYSKCIVVDPQNFSLTISTNDRTLITFDLEKFQFMHETYSFDGDIRSIAYCSREVLAFSYKQFFSLYQLASNSISFTCEELDSSIEELLCNKEYLYAGTEEAEIYIFNWKLGLQIYVLESSSESKINKLWIGGNNLISASSDKITFWDLSTHTRVFSVEPLLKNDVLDVSPDHHLIAYATGSNIIFMQNPYYSKSFRIFGGTMDEIPGFVKILNSIYNLNKVEHNPEYNEWIIMPNRTNIGHIYAIMNMPDNLREFISSGGAIINNSMDYNVLSYCVNKNLDACTVIIIEELKKKLVQNPFSFSFINHNMLQSLNLKGSELLSKLYDLIYITSNQGLISMFGPEDLSLPIYYHSEEFEITQNNFFEVQKQEDNDDSNIPVQYKQSLIKLSLEIGSTDSKSFIRSLMKCPYQDIFTSLLVQDILNEKWNKLKWVLYIQGFVYIAHLFVFGFLLFFPEEAPYLSIVLFILNLLLTIYELFQVYVLLLDYLSDPWNWIDFLRLFSMNLFIILYWQKDEKDPDSLIYFYTNSIVTFLIFLRGISYFRLFESTRYMIDLIKESITDMLGFILVLAFSVISFAFIFYTLEDPKNKSSLIDNIVNSYSINLGGGEIKGGALYKLLFYFATVINPIILLNLLISILGSTFERVESSRIISNYKELASLVLEVEQLFTMKVENRSFFLQSCLMPEEIVIPEPLTAKIKKTSQRLKNMELRFDEAFEKIDTIAENTTKLLEQTLKPESKPEPKEN